MPIRTTLAAAATGLCSGICLAVVTIDGVQSHGIAQVLLLTIVVGFFPTVVVTLAVLGILRRGMTRSEARIRRDFEAMAEQRQRMTDEFERRSATLSDREEAMTRHSALSQAQYRTLVDQLREARAERDAAVKEREELQNDFDVLAGEYNGMVLGEVDQRTAEFTQRRRPRLTASRERRRERAPADPPRVPVIGRQAEPEQHARPAEG